MFFSAPPISDDLADWIVDSFIWHREVHAPPQRLILPTRDFFTAPGGESHETAVAVLADLQRLLGMEKRDIALAPLPDIPDELSHSYERLGDVAGSYEFDADTPLIRYNPKLMRRPILFINTMAHELMHDKLALHMDDVPGGVGAHELATDLHCILHGFGVIQLQAADAAGWTGYMSQSSRAYALELFLAVNQCDRAMALGRMSGRVGKLMKRAGRMKRLASDIDEILKT